MRNTLILSVLLVSSAVAIGAVPVDLLPDRAIHNVKSDENSIQKSRNLHSKASRSDDPSVIAARSNGDHIEYPDVKKREDLDARSNGDHIEYPDVKKREDLDARADGGRPQFPDVKKRKDLDAREPGSKEATTAEGHLIVKDVHPRVSP